MPCNKGRSSGGGCGCSGSHLECRCGDPPSSLTAAGAAGSPDKFVESRIVPGLLDSSAAMDTGLDVWGTGRGRAQPISKEQAPVQSELYLPGTAPNGPSASAFSSEASGRQSPGLREDDGGSHPWWVPPVAGELKDLIDILLDYLRAKKKEEEEEEEDDPPLLAVEGVGLGGGSASPILSGMSPFVEEHVALTSQ